MSDESEEMLINLNSPEKINDAPRQKQYLKNPLIPGPDINCIVESNNPFDIVANSAENWDPFELVLQESLMKFDKSNCIKEDNYKARYKKVFKTPSPKKANVDISHSSTRKVLRSQSVTENVMCFNSQSRNSEKTSHDDKYSVDDSCSIREKIKNAVRRRVSECIESAMNGSLSQPDLRKEKISPFKCMNNVFSQLVGKNLETRTDKYFSVSRTEALKTDTASEEVEFKDRDFGSQGDLDGRLQNNSMLYRDIDRQNKSCPIGGNYPMNESTFPQVFDLSRKNEFFEIQEGAKRISSVIECMSTSTCKLDTKLSSNDEEENLMDIKPPWEEIDDSPLSSESEDSSIGLPKVKLYYVKKKEKKGNEISAEDLAHYKKRIRASLDGNMSCDEESSPTDKTVDKLPEDTKDPVQAKTDEKPLPMVHKDKLPLEALPINKPAPPKVSDLRPKKVGSILKKGPMKAFVPLQKMTRSIAEKVSSPLRKSSQMSCKNESIKQDNSFSSSIIQPVAASTPHGRSTVNNSASDTPVATKTRSRASRKEISKPGTAKRSASLSSDTRNCSGKLPFSSINANVKSNKTMMQNRPHTAPSNYIADKTSPLSKDNKIRKNIKPLASNDKENRMQVF